MASAESLHGASVYPRKWDMSTALPQRTLGSTWSETDLSQRRLASTGLPGETVLALGRSLPLCPGGQDEGSLQKQSLHVPSLLPAGLEKSEKREKHRANPGLTQSGPCMGLYPFRRLVCRPALGGHLPHTLSGIRSTTVVYDTVRDQIMHPLPHAHVDVLAPSTSECDLIWTRDLCRQVVKMRHSGLGWP